MGPFLYRDALRMVQGSADPSATSRGGCPGRATLLPTRLRSTETPRRPPANRKRRRESGQPASRLVPDGVLTNAVEHARRHQVVRVQVVVERVAVVVGQVGELVEKVVQRNRLLGRESGRNRPLRAATGQFQMGAEARKPRRRAERGCFSGRICTHVFASGGAKPLLPRLKSSGSRRASARARARGWRGWPPARLARGAVVHPARDVRVVPSSPSRRGRRCPSRGCGSRVPQLEGTRG